MNYVDIYGRVHDKPVTETNPIPSNNGWIYSAYLKKLGGVVAISNEIGRQCARDKIRSPNMPFPPMGRDEVLGLEYLGFQVVMDDWNFSPFPLPVLNIFKTIATYILAIAEHRNFIWKHGLHHGYCLMFMTPIHDRAFILKCRNKKVPWHYALISWLDSRLNARSDSGSLIRMLKYSQIPDLDVFERYFKRNDHPIYKKAKGLK